MDGKNRAQRICKLPGVMIHDYIFYVLVLDPKQHSQHCIGPSWDTEEGR